MKNEIKILVVLLLLFLGFFLLSTMNLFQYNMSIQAHPDFIYMGDYDYDEILVENEHVINTMYFVVW